MVSGIEDLQVKFIYSFMKEMKELNQNTKDIHDTLKAILTELELSNNIQQKK